MWSGARRLLAAAVIAAFSLQTASCGYILHPERKGQRGGRIDPAIAVLDGLGLLLFLIPGVVAFVIDFHYGTIYLPGGKRAEAGLEGGEPPLKAVKVDGELTPENVAAAVARETGQEIDLGKARVRVADAASEAEMRALLAGAAQDG